MHTNNHSDRIITISVKGLIFDKHHKFLIIRRAKDDSIMPGYWELPGGRLEFGETLEEALIREVHEETNIFIDPIELINTWSVILNDHHQVIGANFLCVTNNDQVEISGEHDNFHWTTLLETQEQSQKYKLYPALVKNMQEWDWDVFREKATASLKLHNTA